MYPAQAQSLVAAEPRLADCFTAISEFQITAGDVAGSWYEIDLCAGTPSGRKLGERTFFFRWGYVGIDGGGQELKLVAYDEKSRQLMFLDTDEEEEAWRSADISGFHYRRL